MAPNIRSVTILWHWALYGQNKTRCDCSLSSDWQWHTSECFCHWSTDVRDYSETSDNSPDCFSIWRLKCNLLCNTVLLQLRYTVQGVAKSSPAECFAEFYQQFSQHKHGIAVRNFTRSFLVIIYRVMQPGHAGINIIILIIVNCLKIISVLALTLGDFSAFKLLH